jgi:hypothetical protein
MTAQVMTAQAVTAHFVTAQVMTAQAVTAHFATSPMHESI